MTTHTYLRCCGTNLLEEDSSGCSSFVSLEEMISETERW